MNLKLELERAKLHGPNVRTIDALASALIYIGNLEGDAAKMQARISHCRCSFTDSDGAVVPGEPCELHPMPTATDDGKAS